MSKRDTRPIEVGDRFETRDPRDMGKIVEVGHVTRNYAGQFRYCIRTEVHPRLPSAVGRTRMINDSTLRDNYKRVSR